MIKIFTLLTSLFSLCFGYLAHENGIFQSTYIPTRTQIIFFPFSCWV
uniref:Uncharacterized protein n=1 Tax=Rhizophora mucronata TaxID=61149 RepID=A0A2P2KYP0_RHIMU